MSAGYLDASFVLSLKITGNYMRSSYKVYEKKGGERQLVFCRKSKMSLFTVKNRNRQIANESKN